MKKFLVEFRALVDGCIHWCDVVECEGPDMDTAVLKLIEDSNIDDYGQYRLEDIVNVYEVVNKKEWIG